MSATEFGDRLLSGLFICQKGTRAPTSSYSALSTLREEWAPCVMA